MPVERVSVSLSQFAELLGLEPGRFLGVEFDRRSTALTLVMEPNMTQTSGTFPQLAQGGKKIGGKKGKKC